MALLDLQSLDTPESDGGDQSSLSLLACDKHSSNSFLLCL
ncbi:SapB/AmfS family lanthipeptide [Streptomyces flavidovirens]|uniref:SapB/AmfS family lanthipeptide n=1 Tax=Streptomyces flavidovirens TaxID=67298 RepID=A0ABW6RAL0_9ACTN|nr:SapB/AmfS family lanthipeptide [Streptomyces sp. ISL-99]MBT2528005.1 SapB/AmfS family lanthipeptide [Streptomyces sp. ISL-99]